MQSPVSVDRLHGPVRLLAGPGAGKTHALVELYADLVGRGLAGRGQILVLTFSTSAAGEIERRLDERLSDSYDQAWISTFHSFCARLLRDHRPDPRRLLLSGFQEWVAMRAVLEELEPEVLGALAPVRRSDAFAQDALSFIALLKQNLVYPAALSLLAEASGSERMRSLAALYQAYQARLEGARLVDFRDLVAEAIALLDARPQLLAELQNRFRYVLIDEFQDVDPAQFELLQRLAPPEARPRLLVAGDPEQSIYGFRGTVPELLGREFPARYDPQRIDLEESRRCPPDLLEAAARLLDGTQGESSVPRLRAPAGSATGPSIRVVREGNSVDEGVFVAREITRLVREEGVAPGRCAVLLRSTTTLSVPFEEGLRALGMPYEVRGLSALSRNEVVRFLLTYMQALANPGDGEALERLLASSLSGAGRRLVGRLRRFAIEEGRAFPKVVRQLMYRLQACDPQAYPLPWAAPAQAGPPAAPAPAEPAAGAATQPAPASAPEAGPAAGAVTQPAPASAPEAELPEYMSFVSEAETRALHGALISLHRLAAEARRLPIYALAHRILNEAGVFGRLFQLPVAPQDRDEAVANLRAALEAFADLDETSRRLRGEGPRLEELAPRLDVLVARAVDDTQPAPSRADAVQVMTVHQAKGLEFDVVFLAGFAQGHFPLPGRPHPLLDEADRSWLETRVEGFRPSWPADPTLHLAEEARLAYVGMTRARRRLYITYAEEYDQTAGPSPFIEQALPGAVHETPGGSAAAVEAASFLTQAEAETLLAQDRDSVSEEQRPRLERLGVDLEFVFDEASGQPFEPYAGKRPAGVDPGHFSPTSLNNYLKCPRLYWYNDHPGLSAPPRGVEMERGSFLHRVLEDFHKREGEWRHLPVESQRDWLEAALLVHLERYLGRVEGTLERKAEEQQVRHILGNYVKFATSSQPIRRLGTLATELKFSVQVDGHEVRGKIDRINDTGEGTCEVVDYKTGRGLYAQRAMDAYFGPELYDVQLAMYHRACLEGVDDEGNPINRRPRFLSLWYPKEFVYGSIRQVLFAIGEPAVGVKEWVQRVVSEEDLARAQEVVASAIRSIGEGDFRPRPKPGAVGTCLSWFGCPHSSICPYGGQPPD